MTWDVGSTWLRWDPHLHAPGTLRENAFGDHTNEEVWDEYFERIRAAQPSCGAIGITDYFVPRGYRLFLQHGGPAKLAGIFAFPNIELRLKTKTDRGHAPNVHLLVCPDREDHLEVIESKLQGLAFSYLGEPFRCTEQDLRRLGRAFRRDDRLDDEAALRVGASQFLVEHDDFAELKRDPWIAANVLFAVAADNDGLAGFAKDGGFAAHREELGHLVDIVFSGQPGQRRFWLGDHPEFGARNYSRKPCLHGSDAHALERVLAPDKARHCWIRAARTFDGLRQTLVEPERRVWIGPEIEPRGVAGDIIHCLRIHNAAWFDPVELVLNDGLVTVIGARGSGKTAFVELLALATDASDVPRGAASFLEKASDVLGELEVEVEWADGTTSRRANGPPRGEPRVRYLSQQFVERLCDRTVTGRTDEPWLDADDRIAAHDGLVDEIERVVFDQIPIEDRMECETFAELRDARLGVPIAERTAARSAIEKAGAAIATDEVLIRTLPKLTAELDEAVRARKALDSELQRIPLQAPAAHRDAYEGVAARHKALQDAIAKQSARTQDLEEIAVAIQQQVGVADEEHERLREQYADVLTDDQWEQLRLRPDAGAMAMLSATSAAVRDRSERLRSHGLGEPVGEDTSNGLVALTEAKEKARKTLGEDAAQTKQRAELTTKLAAAQKLEERKRKAVGHARGASARIAEAHEAGLAAYERIFETLDAEASTLAVLYEPLHARLRADPRLAKLSFRVTRDIDVRAWVRAGEELFDLRKPPFQGRGVLERATRKQLERSWSDGTAAEIREALSTFRDEHLGDALDALRQGVGPSALEEWLLSTDHISIRYAIEYEGVQIANLSPGTRGVVLLTLFLAVDDRDDRPLVIDQPEDNLDPKSVYAALVPFFRDAARRRQIIMVTHNANLVVNTDSDQVVVATAERTAPDSLPTFTYEAGGLEDPRIRELVCQYVEGGEEAFRRRGARYGSIVRPPR